MRVVTSNFISNSKRRSAYAMLCTASYTAGSTVNSASLSTRSTRVNILPAALWYILCVGEFGVSCRRTLTSLRSAKKSSGSQSCQATTEPW